MHGRVLRWDEQDEEYKTASGQFKFHIKRMPIIKKLKNDVADYFFMKETMKNNGGKVISLRIVNRFTKHQCT